MSRCLSTGVSAKPGLLWICVAFIGLGCAERTGLIIEVTRQADTGSLNLQELKFFIGYPTNEDKTRFELIDEFRDEVVSLDPKRDLLTDPYQLLLQRGTWGAKEIVVFVVGTNPENGSRAVGKLADPITFRDGRVLQWEIVLTKDICDGLFSELFDPRLVALYTFDNINGLQVPDTFGVHDGTFQEGEPTLVSDVSGCGSGLGFFGLDGSGLPPPHVVVPDHPQWQLTEGAVDFWVQLHGSLPATSFQGMVSRDAVGVDSSGHFTVARMCGNHIRVRLQGTDNAEVGGACTEAELTVGNWHHIAVNFGGSGPLELFVDGELHDGIPENCPSNDVCQRPTTRGIDGNNNAWVFGASNAISTDTTTDNISDPFNGFLDYIRISNKRRF